MVTILVYTGISFRLAFEKRMMKYENDATKDEDLHCILNENHTATLPYKVAACLFE